MVTAVQQQRDGGKTYLTERKQQSDEKFSEKVNDLRLGAIRVTERLECYMTNDLRASSQSSLDPPFLRHPAELISILTSVTPITPPSPQYISPS